MISPHCRNSNTICVTASRIILLVATARPLQPDSSQKHESLNCIRGAKPRISITCGRLASRRGGDKFAPLFFRIYVSENAQDADSEVCRLRPLQSVCEHTVASPGNALKQ